MDILITPLQELDMDNLKALKVLGKGSMGTVFLVYDRTSDPSVRNPFALKVVDKSSLHTKFGAERRARWEIQVLSRFSYPFLPSLLSSFETQDFFGWAIPYCSGGDLNVLRHRQTDRVFTPAAIRFYLSEIICAIEHLHSMGIAYRDLKPENVLIQHSGHVTLTDFDLSRSLKHRTVDVVISSEKDPSLQESNRRRHRRNLTRWIQVFTGENFVMSLKKAKSARVSPVTRKKLSFSNGERSNSFVGTEEYVSPEVVIGVGHEFAVDWWGLGVLTYEMMYGRTPFKGKNRKETFHNVVTKQPEFIGKPNLLTDLIKRLLEKDPTKRLGYSRGACEIKEHAFFQGVRWDKLTEVLRPPFIPTRNNDELITSNEFDIKDYFQKLRPPPPSMPPSPDCQQLMEF